MKHKTADNGGTVMSLFPHTEHPIPLEMVPFEWLDLLMRQVQWASDELDDIIVRDLTKAEQECYDKVLRHWLLLKDRLSLERVRRLAVFLDEQCAIGTPLDAQQQQAKTQKEEK